MPMVMIMVVMMAMVTIEFGKETVEGGRVRIKVGFTRRVDENAIIVDIVGIGQEGYHRCENN
jgi:hypothetical protein